MGQYAQPVKSHNGFVTIDWMVLAVACIAVLFLIGTMIRISVDADTIIQNDGFHQLGAGDELLAFQDFSFGATGWSPAITSDALPGLGPVLGPFVGEVVERTFTIPSDTAVAHLSFDLHLIGDWAGQGDFHIALGGDEVLTIRIPTGAVADSSALEILTADTPNLQIIADRHAVSPRPAHTALPDARDDFVTLHIGMHVSDLSETLVLRLMAEAAGDVRWTLDNLTVVATVDGGAVGS